jgi:WD40 repeat protein
MESKPNGKDRYSFMNPSNFDLEADRIIAFWPRALTTLLVLGLTLAGCTWPGGSGRPASPISDPELSSALQAPTPLPTWPYQTATSTPAVTATPHQSAPAIAENDLDRLQEMHAFQMDGVVNDLAFSPDGLRIAAASEEGVANVWRIGDGSLAYTLRGHEGSINSVAFSPDGSLLATGSSDQSVRLWNAGDGTLERTITSGTLGRVLSLEFSSDGDLLAVADHLCFVQLREVRTGLLRRSLAQPDCSARLGGTVISWALGFSPDGERVLTGEGRPCCGGSLQSWLVHEVEAPELIKGYNLRFQDLDYAPDGETIAVAFLSSAVFWLMDPLDGRQIQTFEGHTYRVNSVTFSHGGDLIASGGRDYKVRLWRTEDGELLRTLEAHSDEVFSVTFSADGSLLASGGADGLVVLWNTSNDG